MATYLVLSNRVLNALNEVEMTSANFSSSRGIQTSVKNFVNRGPKGPPIDVIIILTVKFN